MDLKWVTYENPVAIWWIFLVSVSAINILTFVWSRYFIFNKIKTFTAKDHVLLKRLFILGGLYVFGCAFRSVLPRADVQRICLFDTWWSTVLVGRTIATIAEVAFIAQWALVINHIANHLDSQLAKKISHIIVPTIVVAECFSWYAVITTHYLGNTCEESLWAVTYVMIAISLFDLMRHTKGPYEYAFGIGLVGCLFYVSFMGLVDVPMYFGRWQSDIANGKQILNLFSGFHDLNTRWVVSHDIKDWKQEIPWMSLYFSVAVWTSILLCYTPSWKIPRFKAVK